MPTVAATKMTPGQIDEMAHAIAEAHAAGDIDATEAAGRFASLVVMSSTLDAVSWYPAGLSVQQRLDLAESMRWGVMRAVLDTDRGFFDIERMRTASFTGWLRQTGVTFASRDGIVRPRSAAERLTLVTDITSPGASSALHSKLVHPSAEQAFEHASVLGDMDTLVGDPDVLLASTKGMRASTRTFALAAAVRQSMRLPRLCLPMSMSDRLWVVETCEADPRAAARSVRAVVTMLCGLDEGRIDTDERLLALWDDCSLEQLQRLELAPDELVCALVLGQAMPAPKPSRAVVRALRKEAKSLVSSRGWQELAALLVASYLARTTSPVSDFDGLADEVSRVAMAAEAQRLAEQWPHLVERACSWPGAPMGSDEEELDVWLSERLYDLTEST